MTRQSIFVACYGALILIGGIIGYVVAHSAASLIASSAISLAFFICTPFIKKGSVAALSIATALTTFLLCFFTYRFFLAFKIAPGGIMAVISALMLVYLLRSRTTTRV